MTTSHQQKRTEEVSYDTVPYDSNSFPHTHARHLYTVAKLFQLNPPDLDKCRVLELGCASGGNLLPQAQQYPDAEFIGVDISSEQISLAQEALGTLKFKNIKFIQKDISDITKEFGTFDYIITHGVFSWVPEDVRENIFKVYKENLSENGIGFISYNTLPGWNMVRSIRDVMVFHSKRFETPREKVIQSRALLNFLSANINENDPYKLIIDQEKKGLEESNDYYIYHEHLEEENNQFYLHEFVENAERHGLRYVGDSSVGSMYLGNMTKQVAKELSALGKDIVTQEQYMDFIKNRRFRNSIITHDNLELNRKIESKRIFDFPVTTNLKIDEEKSTDEKTVFHSFYNKKDTVSFDDPDVTSVFIKLSKNGMKPILLDDIIKNVCKKKEDRKRVEELITGFGIQMVMREFLYLHADQGNFTDKISKKPVASPLARYQASHQKQAPITNCLGDRVRIDALHAIILEHLDGTHDIKSLISIVTKKIESGELTINKKETDENKADNVKEIVKKSVERALNHYARSAILIK